MWWWQSQAPGGAFTFASSLPEELGTGSARPGATENPELAAASAEAPLMKVRRAIMGSSDLLDIRLLEQANPTNRRAAAVVVGAASLKPVFRSRRRSPDSAPGCG